MASSAIELPVVGRVDRLGHLVSADPPLLELQESAGAALGRPLAVPQLAALARSAQSLAVPLSRSILAANAFHDFDLWVRAEPADGEIVLRIERWHARPASPPRLAPVDAKSEPDPAEVVPEREPMNWSTDDRLHFIEVSPALADMLGIPNEGAKGQPLTRVIRLLPDKDGRMPLLAAMTSASGTVEQRAVSRTLSGLELVLKADLVIGSDGRFDGFSGQALAVANGSTPAPTVAGDAVLDEALRSPLDRIVEAADRIGDRADGPLRSDYASYASDIAAAGRHLLSVVHSMSADAGRAADRVELIALVEESLSLVEAAAEARGIMLSATYPDQPIIAQGEKRGIVQILVNILGNAIRHSPVAATVTVDMKRDGSAVDVSVLDEGPGIAAVDQRRIFERYEQVGSTTGEAGLGLAISRRLARSMGGDITLDSTPGAGARFTLRLPLP